MSYEYEGSVDVSDGSTSFKSIVTGLQSKVRIVERGDRGFRFYYNDSPENSWGCDAELTMSNGSLYLAIHTGTASQREDIVHKLEKIVGSELEEI